VSTPHPGAFVYWDDEPGWVNFGRGKLYPDKLGIISHPELRVIDAVELSLAVRRLVSEAKMSLFGNSKNFDNFLTAVRNYCGRRASQAARELFQPQGNSDVRCATEQPPNWKRDEWHPFDHTEYLAIRKRLRLSREYVTQIITDLETDDLALLKPKNRRSGTALTVSVDQLKYFEEHGGTRVPFMASKLDRVYRTDGHTCREVVDPIHRRTEGDAAKAEVKFPDFWVGPVVVTITSPSTEDREGRLNLTWGPWRTPLIVTSGRGVTCRSDTPKGKPLEIEYPSGWELKVEIGFDPDAIDINGDVWDPKSVDAGMRILKDNVPIYKRLWEQSQEDLPPI
jgi:hypothetical protein